jgi:predicted N-acyltransferase
MADQGISMAAFQGDQIPEAFFPLMYRLYSKTNDQFGIWGCKYLTPDFFDQLYDHFRQRLLFTAAFNGDHRDLPVAMAMLLTKRDRLYGRYWGTVKEANAIHFNTCYYKPIEWAIERGVRQFDPGIGGGHKIRRGFEAVPNFSLHRFFDPRLQQIMDNHIHQINAHEAHGIDAINQQIPFSARTASDG